MAVPRWTPQRNTTWAGDLPSRPAAAVTAG